MTDKQDTQTERIQRINRALVEVFELARTATFTVDVEDFGNWLAALDRTEFYVSRREGNAELFVFHNGMWRGHYVSVHARGATEVLGYEIPEDPDAHMTLPASEAVNVRSASAVIA